MLSPFATASRRTPHYHSPGVASVASHAARTPMSTTTTTTTTTRDRGDRYGPIEWAQQGPSVNKEYLSQIQLYSMFGELPVLSNTVLIITVCVKVANSTFLVTNKRTKWAELSRYYLCNCFVR